MLGSKKKLCLILALFIIQTLLIGSVFAQASPVAYIQFGVSKIQTRVDESFPIDITINTPNTSLGMSGFNICIRYDPLLIFISSTKKPKDSQKNNSIFTKINNTIDNDLGKTCFSYVVILPDKDLPHTIYAVINAKGISEGTSSIEIVDSQIVGNVEKDEYILSTNNLSIETSGISPHNTFESFGKRAQKSVSQIVSKIFGVLNQLF